MAASVSIRSELFVINSLDVLSSVLCSNIPTSAKDVVVTLSDVVVDVGFTTRSKLDSKSENKMNCELYFLLNVVVVLLKWFDSF